MGRDSGVEPVGANPLSRRALIGRGSGPLAGLTALDQLPALLDLRGLTATAQTQTLDHPRHPERAARLHLHGDDGYSQVQGESTGRRRAPRRVLARHGRRAAKGGASLGRDRRQPARG